MRSDTLTGLANADRFDERLEQEMKRWRRTGAPLSLLVVDLRGTGEVNRLYGHAAGNRMIRKAADQIRTSLREGIDEAFRYGGDEFAILLPETDHDGALKVQERIRSAVSAVTLEKYGKEYFRASCLCGTATAKEPGAEHLIKDAILSLTAEPEVSERRAA